MGLAAREHAKGWSRWHSPDPSTPQTTGGGSQSAAPTQPQCIDPRGPPDFGDLLVLAPSSRCFSYHGVRRTGAGIQERVQAASGPASPRRALPDAARLPPKSSRQAAPAGLVELLPDGLFPGVIDPISASKLNRETS